MERLPEFIGNHLFLVSLFAAILILLVWNVFGGMLSGIEELAPAEVTRLLNRERGVLVDVRSADDFQGGHILDALNVPAAGIDGEPKPLEKYKSRPVITCCENGTVSLRVARTLRSKGYEKVYCMKGGLGAWRSAGLPVIRAKT